MIALSAGMALLAAWGILASSPGPGTDGGTFPRENALRIAVALFGAGFGVLLLLFRSLLPAGARVPEIPDDPARRHLPEPPSRTSPRPAESADPEARNGDSAGEGSRTPAGGSFLEERLREITGEHADLIAHHRITKRMLQSMRVEEVLQTLVQGVRDGLGFTGTILGVRDPDGNLIFQCDTEDGEVWQLNIPSWDDGSVIARTFWGGNSLFLKSFSGHNHRVEDGRILGEGPAYLIPVRRKGTPKYPEKKPCILDPQGAPGSAGGRCRAPWEAGQAIEDPVTALRKRHECARCNSFADPAILVVREKPDSRAIGPETVRHIDSLVSEASLALEVVDLHEKTRILSVTDGLTGLSNHREFYSSLQKELERARRYSHTVSLLMIDVDDFKKFNDRYGHMAGDRALKSIASILKKNVRATDVVARYGGEEFGIILPESTPVGSQMLAERIKTEIAGHTFLDEGGGAARLTVSIGIYSSERGEDSEDMMVGFADEAAYLAKHSGKNKVVVKAHA